MPRGTHFAKWRNVKLRTKLLLTFLVFIVLIAAAGGAGLFFVNKIQGEVKTFAEVASPMANTTSTIVDQMQKAHIALLELLQVRDTQEIQQREAIVAAFDQTFGRIGCGGDAETAFGAARAW